MKLVFIVSDTRHVNGRGTVITGIVGGGKIEVGDYLHHDRTKNVIHVKGIETMAGRQDIPIGLLVGWHPNNFEPGDTLTGCIVSVQV